VEDEMPWNGTTLHPVERSAWHPGTPGGDAGRSRPRR